MNWFLNPCRRYRWNLCLLASGLLSESDRAGIEKHLAGCADCRRHYDQIKMVTVPLAGWEKHFAHIELDAAVQLRLAKAIASADKSKSIRAFKPEVILRDCWQQLIWPSRQIWAGLAVVWVLLLVTNVSMRDSSQITVAKTSPTPEMILSFRQQEKILAELMGPNEARSAVPPKPFSPRPSSERRFEILTT
jgi:anti-sigma factor RsiW